MVRTASLPSERRDRSVSGWNGRGRVAAARAGVVAASLVQLDGLRSERDRARNRRRLLARWWRILRCWVWRGSRVRLGRCRRRRGVRPMPLVHRCSVGDLSPFSTYSVVNGPGRRGGGCGGGGFPCGFSSLIRDQAFARRL
jgi:hypothetical protein